MSRSLRVQESYISTVKLALRRNGFSSQRALAEDVGFALATVSNFLTGKPVDFSTFEELCQKLALDWREVSTLNCDTPRVPASPSAQQAGEISASDDSGQDRSPPYPNGAVPLGSPFYLQRDSIETQIYQEIRKPGALVRIKAPREMGKTSLLNRALDFAKQLGSHTVSLNLEQVDQAIICDLNQLLRWLCANVAHQLRLQPKLDKYWDEDLGSKISATLYVQDYLLESINAPLVLALDEVNQVFEHPQVAKDFLPLLRSWFEEAKTLPIWQKLRLIVVHSTEIYVPLHLSQSPFNVGLPIQLGYFSREEVEQLAQRYGLDWEKGEQAKQLMGLVGGHPALVNLSLYQFSRSGDRFAQVLETAPTTAEIYQNHLQRHWTTLAKQPDLKQAFDSILAATEPISLDPITTHKLSSMGLIKSVQDKSTASCELYRQYFK